MRRIFILVLVAFALDPGIRGVAGVDCSAWEDPVGATFRHTAARMEPCYGKGPGAACTYLLNLTLPDGSLHTQNLHVDGCCVVDASGDLFCSSARSKDANPTSQTVRDLFQLKYICQGGQLTTASKCPEENGFVTRCRLGVNERNCYCTHGTSDQPDSTLECRCVAPNEG